MTRVPARPLLQVASGVLAGLFAFPALYLVWRNFTTGADPIGLLFSERTLGPLWRTLRLAVTVSFSAALLGTALAWLSTRTDIPLRRFWRSILPIPLVFPTFIGAAAFIRTLNPGGLANDALERFGIAETFELRGFFGAWLVLTLFTYPYVFLPVASRLVRLPASFEESARVLGDTPAQTFKRIVLPQISTAVAAGTLLVFLYTISDFGAVQLMRYDTLTRAIETNLARPQIAFAMSLILLVLALVVVVVEQRLTRKAAVAPSGRSARQATYSLGRWRVPSLAGMILAAGLAVGAPMVAIVDWAADGLLRTRRGGRPLTIDSDKVIEASWHTLESSVLTAIVAVAAVLPVAYLVGRYRSRLGNASLAVVTATFAIPGILIALALRFWTLRSGIAGDLLYDTKVLLIFAYVVRFGSLAMGVALVAVQTVPDRFHDAAKTLGASRGRRLSTIDVPLMAPGLLAAAGLVLLSTMKELPISLILAPLGYPTLTTRIFGSFEEAFVAEAGIMAAVLVIMSAALSWFLVLRRADHL